MNPLTLTQLRMGLLAAGFHPLPVQGKCVLLTGWTTIDIDNNVIEYWGKQFPHWSNTGLRCRDTPTLDIDISHPAAAEAVEALARARFAEHGQVLVRIGNAPKRAIPFRTATPFRKISVNLIAPDGTHGKLEFLGDGQQFVVDGIHPDTQQPYRWLNGAPGVVKLSELPEITEQGAAQFIDEAVEVLELEHGFKRATATRAASERTEFDDTAAPPPDEVHPVVVEEYQEYLQYIDSDIDYETWFQICCALFNTLGPETGKRVAIEWSARGKKFKAGELERKWNGINAKNAYGFGRQTILNAWALACEAQMTEQERADLKQSVENIVASAKRKQEHTTAHEQKSRSRKKQLITIRASDVELRATD